MFLFPFPTTRMRLSGNKLRPDQPTFSRQPQATYRYSSSLWQPERRAARNALSGGCPVPVLLNFPMLVLCPKGHAPAGYESQTISAATLVTSPSIRSVRFGRQRILRCHQRMIDYKFFAGPEPACSFSKKYTRRRT